MRFYRQFLLFQRYIQAIVCIFLLQFRISFLILIKSNLDQLKRRKVLFDASDPLVPSNFSLSFLYSSISIYHEAMTTMVNQVQCSLPILFSFAFLAGFLVSGESANLRAGFSNSVTEESTIIQDSDLVEGSSYLVIQLDGYDMQDLRRISPQKQAIIECAFHEAFNEIHGDNDGLYLSGQQVVAADRSDEEDDNGADDALVDGIGFGFKYVHRPRKFPPKNRDRPSNPPPREYKKKYSWEDKWNIYWHTEFTGMCNLCKLSERYRDGDRMNFWF